jgi:hypothetical protein
VERKYFLHAGVALVDKRVELNAVWVVVATAYNHGFEGRTVW